MEDKRCARSGKSCPIALATATRATTQIFTRKVLYSILKDRVNMQLVSPTELSIKPLPRDSNIQVKHLDASAAVKLVIMEPGSETLRGYFHGRGHFCITTLCLAEALGVLKRKLNNQELSRDEYFTRCHMLLGYVRTGKIKNDQTEATDLNTFLKAEEVARQHTDLDLSDCLQLVSVKYGEFSKFGGESKTMLITADAGLEKAARREGLLVWNPQTAQKPRTT